MVLVDKARSGSMIPLNHGCLNLRISAFASTHTRRHVPAKRPISVQTLTSTFGFGSVMRCPNLSFSN